MRVGEDLLGHAVGQQGAPALGLARSILMLICEGPWMLICEGP